MEVKNYKILLFYKYVPLPDALEIVEWMKKFCENTDIKGRVLIATEGINGTVGGTEEEIDFYLEQIKADPRFADIDFKKSSYNSNPFPKLKIKLRKEIVTLGLDKDIDINTISEEEKGKYLEPDEVQNLLDSGEELYFIDARNDYEASIGKFEKAIVFDIENFRDLPQKLEDIGHLKKKKIIWYCTGGVRCEKLTAYVKTKGFEDVYHIKGGIQRYAEKHPEGGYKGSMYVFDDRIAVRFDKDKATGIIGKCDFCDQPDETPRNCFNPTCNKRMIVCDDCYKERNGCCSMECEQVNLTRKDLYKFTILEANIESDK